MLRGRPPVVACALLVAVTTVGALAGGRPQAPDPRLVEAGARLDVKLDRILGFAGTSAPEPRLTRLLESEINAYLSVQAVPVLPVGLTAPAVGIGDGGRVSAEAVVDLNKIREERARSWLDPLQFLAGRLPVTASGRVEAANGYATLAVETVSIAGVAVPVSVLQELVAFYTRTTDHPSGTRLDEPIALPYGITELRLSPGRVTVVQ